MSNKNRSSRSNRWEEITHQEQLILAKKREIEERLKSSGDVSMKSDQNILTNDSTSVKPPSSLLTQTTSSEKFSSPSISSISTSISKTLTSSSNTANDQKASETTNSDSQENQFVNKFQNDGSFLEMFKKMQQKSESSVSSSSTEKTEGTNSDIQPKLEDIDERVKFTKQDCDLRLDQQTKGIDATLTLDVLCAVKSNRVKVH